MTRCRMLFGLLLAVSTTLFTSLLFAQSWQINSPEKAAMVWQTAQAGDIVDIAPGRYPGPWKINQSLTIKAQAGAILDGQAKGHALQISASNVWVSGLQIVNWGDDIGQMESGVFVDKTSESVTLENLSIKGSSFGIWVDGSDKVTIKNNRIQGNLDVRSPDRGNGIHLFNVGDALIQGNEVWHSRDGIYIDTSNNNQLVGNYLHDLRYGIHYMYSYHNLLKDNKTERTRTGYALMQSKFLTVLNNQSLNDFNYGMLLNFITQSQFKGNKISRVRQGRNPNTNLAVGTNISGADGKAMFIYNSVYNEIDHNQLSQSDLAIHLTGGSTDNKIFANAFIGNRNQVKYVSNRAQEWSFESQGNYWSDYLGWDIDQDGLGDSQYSPNNAIDKLLWQFPSARLLFNSPGVLLLRWVEGQFPVFKRPGITDSHPMMAIKPEHKDDALLSSQLAPKVKQEPTNGS